MRSSLLQSAACAMVAVVMLLSVCSHAFAGTTGTITGAVVDAATKAPIAGAVR